MDPSDFSLFGAVQGAWNWFWSPTPNANGTVTSPADATGASSIIPADNPNQGALGEWASEISQSAFGVSTTNWTPWVIGGGALVLLVLTILLLHELETL